MKRTLKNHNLKRGFTLLELLVALSIFSVLSVMAYGGLQTVITTKQATEKAADRTAEIQLVVLRISNDLRQSVSRRVRDEYGDFLAAMQSSQSGDETMAWTRAGYRNPARLKRSHVQRVAYRLEQQKLIRITWPVLDRAQDTEPMKIQVLTKVESVEWRFLNNEDQWGSVWPEQRENTGLYPVPKAVEFTLELTDWGKVRRLILLANES